MASVNYQDVSDAFLDNITTQDKAVKAALTKVQLNPGDTASLLALQSATSQWGALVSAMTAMIKELSDMHKGICQKIG